MFVNIIDPKVFVGISGSGFLLLIGIIFYIFYSDMKEEERIRNKNGKN